MEIIDKYAHRILFWQKLAMKFFAELVLCIAGNISLYCQNAKCQLSVKEQARIVKIKCDEHTNKEIISCWY